MNASRRKEKTKRILEILQKRNSPLYKNIKDVIDIQQLPRDIREKIVDELGDEFCLKGLGSNDEPNAYGIEIEELTDACGLTNQP